MTADFILFVHFFLVVFVTSCFFLIPIGYKLDWKWPKNKKVRILHVTIMLFITVETVLGFNCPLTIIENDLRGIENSYSFVGYWVNQFIYWDFPKSFFMILYSLCLAWTCLLWKFCSPNGPKNNSSNDDDL